MTPQPPGAEGEEGTNEDRITMKQKRNRVIQSEEAAVNPKYTYPELFLRVDWLKYVYEFGFDA